MSGLTDADGKLQGDGPFIDYSIQVQAVCASATPADFVNWGKERRARNDELADKELAAKISPITYVSNGL